MKLKLIAVAVMSLTATASFAQTKPTCSSTVTDITHINWCAPEATLFIAGSSALSAAITAVIPDLFDISDSSVAADSRKKIYKISDASTTGNTNGNKGGTTVWYGTSKAGVFGTQKRLAIVYNNNNGSGAGVSLVMGPVKTTSARVSTNPIESNVIFVGPNKNVANTCSLNTSTASVLETISGVTYAYASLVNCTNTKDAQADLAISDVRAQEIYKFYSNVPKTVKYTDFVQKPLVYQGFGLIVNWTMYKALQDVQAGTHLASTCGGTATDDDRRLPACQPSVRSIDYATLVANNNVTKSAALFGLSDSTKLILARRDDLSGTQSASNIYFLRNSCNLNTTLGGGIAVLDTETDGTKFQMVKYATSGLVRTAANSASNYVIGAAALAARSIVKDEYNFVKIDGISPNVVETGATGTSILNGREAFSSGDYNFAFTAYGIYKKTLDSSLSDQSTLVAKLIAAMRDSTKHNVSGVAYLDGVADSGILKQSKVNRFDGNNCAPIMKM